MAPSDDYSSIPSTGRLKLKGVKDSKVDKKKSKKKKAKLDDGGVDEAPAAPASDGDHSVMLRKLEEEDKQMRRETDARDVDEEGGQAGSKPAGEEEELGDHVKTEAERRYDEQRRKRLDERLKREGVKTHKQRVEELNRYLSGLSEHHDMPRIGPG